MGIAARGFLLIALLAFQTHVSYEQAILGRVRVQQPCDVPQPGLDFRQCNFDLEPTDPETFAWTTNEMDQQFDKTRFGAVISFSQPLPGSLETAYRTCLSRGSEVVSYEHLVYYWPFYSFNPPFSGVHVWKKFSLWEGGSPAYAYGGNCTQIRSAGRTLGARRLSNCSSDTGYEFFVCGSCEGGKLYDPVQGCVSSCPEGSIPTTGRACTSCPPGEYYMSGVGACGTCPSGEYSNMYRSLSCTPCPPGSFNDSPGLLSCSLCPANTYQALAGQSSCDACPVNTVGTKVGSSTADDCVRA